jgi:hypothetical protein
VENRARTVIVAVSRDAVEHQPAALLAGLQQIHPLVAITGGQASGPLVVSLPTGEVVHNAQEIKAAALKMLVDAGWDVISVYVERRDLESIYAQTLSPVAQAQTGITSTGPLVTGPLAMPEQSAPSNMGAMTGPLDSRFTRPLITPSEEGPSPNGREIAK